MRLTKDERSVMTKGMTSDGEKGIRCLNFVRMAAHGEKSKMFPNTAGACRFRKFDATGERAHFSMV